MTPEVYQLYQTKARVAIAAKEGTWEMDFTILDIPRTGWLDYHLHTGTVDAFSS